MQFRSPVHFFVRLSIAHARIPSFFSTTMTLLAALLVSPLLRAETALPVVEVEEISVTAERPKLDDPDTIDPQINTGFSTRVNRTDWVSDAGNLGDVLAKTPGIQVRKTGGLGGFAFMSLRGSLSDQVAIYLDGFLLNDASGGGVNINSIGLGEIESVDVYQGMSPFQGGRAPIGGAIFLRSRAFSAEDRTTLNVGLGNQGSSSAGINANKRFGNSRIVATLDHLSGSNDFYFRNDNGTTLNAADDSTQARRNNGYVRDSALLKLDTPLSESQALALSYRGYRATQHLPTWHNLDAHTSLGNELQHLQLKLNSTSFPLWYTRSSIALDFQSEQERYDDHLGEVGLGQQDETAITRTTGLRWFADRDIGANLFQTSLDWRFETYDSVDTFHPEPTKYDRISYGAAISATVFHLADRLIIKPSLIAQGYVGNSGAVAAPRTILDSLNLSPQLGVRYAYDSRWVLKANLSRGQRDPALYELFGDHGFFLGNPELVPEHSINTDVGFELSDHLASQNISLQWTGAFFGQEIRDGITKTYNAQGVGKAINIGRAQIVGVESTLKATHLAWGAVTYGTTWLDARNETTTSMAYRKQLPGRFPETHSLLYQWGGPQFQLHADFLFQRGLYFDSLNFFQAKNRQTLDAGVSSAHKYGELSLTVQNLTNQQYQDFNGYPYAGRLFLAGYKISF